MNNPTITKQVNMSRFSFGHSLRFDNDLSCIYFNDFIMRDDVHLEDKTYYKNSLIIIGDLHSKCMAKSSYNKMKKSELVDLYNTLNPNRYLEINDYTKADIISDIADTTKLEYILAMREYLDNRDFFNEFVDYALRGYSQGDYCDVIELDTDSVYKQELHNLFYDAPVSGNITIHDNLENESYELYVDDYIENAYEYNKDELVKSLSDCQYNKTQNYYNALIEWANENLPKYLEHA